METLGFFNIKQSYLNNTMYNNYNKICFKGDGGNLSKLEHINKEKYSYTHKKDAEYLSLFIKNIINNDIENTLIIDGTTSLGGNIISFIHHFKFIIGIEINQIRFHKLLFILNKKFFIKFVSEKKIFKNASNNIILINDSFNNYIDFICKFQKKNKVIYLDPPWGGKNYKNYNNIVLGLAGIPLHFLVKNIKDKDNDIIIILKLPLNYYLDSFINEIKDIIKLEKFFYIYL